MILSGGSCNDCVDSSNTMRKGVLFDIDCRTVSDAFCERQYLKSEFFEKT